MPTYANPDAEHVAHGIRLGGGGSLLDTTPDSPPLTVEALERLTRPDLYAKRDEEHRMRLIGETGMLRLYTHDDDYTIACDWFGWLPGHYTTRKAALAAYGYVLGGENAGYLDRLAQPRPEGYTLGELEAFATTAA